MSTRAEERISGLRRLGAAALISLLALGPATRVAGEEVSRKVPPIYREKLAAFLTPLKEVLRTESPAKAGEDDGVVLLDEEFHYIDEKGRRYMVDHRINKALNDSGAKEIAEEVHSYRKANQKIYLVSADTILPDGKRQAIRPGAAILQSPQRQADYSLYDDQGELRLIFPNIKPGAITESIIMVEESRFRMPGQFTACYSWAFGWPMARLRRMIEMPSALADRLTITTTGHTVPAVEKTAMARGRVRFQWDGRDIAGLSGEQNQPPTHQVGPALWLTTLPDWDAFVQWYAPLVNERSTLKPALLKHLDEWTKSATTPAEMLDILMAKAANEVRYTGLEFGAADLQPHDCNDVWENQYGDCKDKTNLLRAMLQRQGIPAYLVLINTVHAGLIERRSPDYRQFNHAIVAVELTPGQYVFCDPTISYARPGLLSPGDADRDVLLIKGNTAEWAHTPPQDAGRLHYQFELKLAADGGLSGWLTQESSGYYGASHADYYQRLDKDRLREKAGDLVEGFFKAAEVVDVTRSPLEKWDGAYQLKTYFVVPGTNGAEQGRTSLAFPQSGVLFVDPGARKSRQTPFYTWRDTIKVTAHIQLPDGLAATGQPRPIQVSSPVFDGTAQWAVEGGACHATLELRVKQSLISTDQFEGFFNSLLSLRSWLANPLTFATADGKPPAPAAPSVALDDFPVMGSGEGQIALVEQRFPASGDPRLRREALQKVMQYFPADKPTQFNAAMRLAMMDWTDDTARQAAEQFQRLLRTYKDALDVQDAAWGEYLLALALKQSDQSPEALKIFERIATNTTVTSQRRSWSNFQRAKILESKSATAAIKALREGLALESDAQPSEFVLLAKLLILDGRMADLKKEIKLLLDKKPPQFLAMLTRLAASADDLLPAEKAAQRSELLQVLEDVEKSNELGKRFTEALQSSRDNIRAADASELIRENLKRYLAKNPLPELGPEAAQFKTRADFSKAVAQAEKDRKPELCVAYDVTLLTRFEPDADFASYLWKATSHADWKERFHEAPEPLLPVLLDLCEQLPPTNDTHIDGRLLRARGFERHGDLDSAQKIHEDLLRDPALSAGYKVACHMRLAANLEKRRDYRQALATYRLVEQEVEYGSAKDGLLRAVFLHLEMGSRDEALRILEILAGINPDVIKQVSTGEQIAELVTLRKDPKKAAAYWDSTAQWWPDWLALEQKLGLKPTGDEQIIPAIADLQSFGADAGIALRGKDRPAVLAATRELAHAARWQPTMTVELFGLLVYLPSFIPECAEDVRKFAAHVSDLLLTDDPELARKSQMYNTIFCIDLAQNARALKIIHAFHAQPRVDDGVAHSMARLWAVAAQQENQDLALATAAVEQALASTKLQDRGLTVTSLANLYRQAGRADDEEQLLKREIENPRIKAVTSDLQSLTTRYQQVSQVGEESRKLTAAVKAWLEKSKPAWFDYAEPKSLDDPRLSNLDDLLKNPSQLFIPAEMAKLYVLIAASPNQPFDRRQQSFLEALGHLDELALTVDEARQVYEPIIDNEAFPEWLRIESLWRALLDARLQEQNAAFEKLRQYPLVAKFNDTSKNALQIFHDALAVDVSSGEAMAAFCERLLGKDLNGNSLMELRGFYNRLLNLGELDLAGKIYRKLADATISGEARFSKASLQMDFLKSLNRAKKWQPFGAALRDLIRASQPEEKPVAPAIFATLHDRFQLDWLDQADEGRILRYQILTRQIDPADFSIWKSFVQDLRTDEAGRKLALEMIATAVRRAPGDTERAAAVMFALAAVDTDDPAIRTALAEIFRPHRKAEEFPVTYGEIRLQELHQALRLGAPVDVENDFENLHLPKASAMANFVKLRHYLQTRQVPQLRKCLESIDPNELLSERLVSLSLRAFQMTGMNDELDLARVAAQRSIYRHILQAWTTLDSWHFVTAFDLAEALHDPALLPPEWLDSTTRRMMNQRVKLTIATDNYHLRQDWPQLLQNAEEGARAFPTFYHFSWHKGAALYHLDKKLEAVEALRIYTQYAKDELEYSQAMDWLHELEPAAGSEPKQ